MKQRDPKTGRYVRTNPDYKAEYERYKSMYERKHMECDKLEHELKLQKQGYDLLRQDMEDLKAERDRWMGYCTEKDYRIEFLLDHCGLFCKWLFRRKFVKGGSK